MPEYLSPGVYVEEFKIGAQPIEGVSTSTAAFVGIAEKGPLNKPTLVTNQKDFIGIFGGYIKDSYLAYAVDGFFRNGGKRCFIVRVADSSASKAHKPFNNNNGLPLMEISAVNEGEWGNKINITIKEASSGSTTLFLSKLSEDTIEESTSIKLLTTVGLSKGSSILITDGSPDPESRTVVSLGPENIVTLDKKLEKVYNHFITYVCVQLLEGSTSAAVKSISGFSKGMLVGFHSADPATHSDYVTLSDVKQPYRLFEWSKTPLSNQINGAECFDIKGIEIKLELLNIIIPESNQIIVSSKSLPQPGDEVTFSSRTKKETLIVKTVKVQGDTATIDFEGKFSNGYTVAGTEVIAMTLSKTKLFSTTLTGVKTEDNKSTITLKEAIKGLSKTDSLTLFDNSNKPLKFEIDFEAIGHDEKKVPLKSVIDELNILKDSPVYLTLNKKEIVVDSIDGFHKDDLIDMTIDTNTIRYSINTIEKNGNRIKLDGPDLPNSGIDPDIDPSKNFIIAKQWISTRVKSQDFQITAVYGNNEIEEKFDKLSIDSSSERYFAKEGIINKVSSLVEITDIRTNKDTLPTSIENMPASVSYPLDGGDDGTANIAAADYIGAINQKDERTGIVALEPVDEISLLAIPDIMNGKLLEDSIEQVQLAMITHCENSKDRFAILDPIKNSTVQDVLAWRKDNLDSKYAALYYPWIKVSDPIAAENSISRFIPPSGHIAGIYARSDAEHGVHKAPANEVLFGVTELDRNLTAGEQDVLNPEGVNCIRAFPGRGIRVWGARTISSDTLWKYINIRRLFIYIEKSIEINTQWIVFEPNNEKLWARVRATITQFLTTIWKDGALMGTKVEEAFFVKCDRTTMTQDEIDNGKLICIIGIAPVKPAEFVIFRIAQWAGGSAATE